MSIEAKIDELIAAVKENTAALKGGASSSKTTTSKAAADDAPAEKKTTTRGKAAGTKTTKKEVTREDVVTLFNKVREDQGTDAAKALVKKLGVTKLAELEEDQFEEAIKLANAALEDEGDGENDDDI